MPGVKTAISLDEELFDRVNALAKRMHVSRSRLFTLAVNEYLKKQENEMLLAKLNKAYDNQAIDEEQRVAKSMKAKQRKIVEQEPW